MAKKAFFQYLTLRRAFGAAFIIFIAVYLSHQFSLAEEFWVTTTAMLVMQTAVGLTARQSLQRFIVILLSLLIASFFVYYLSNETILSWVAILFFTFCVYFSLANKLNRSQVNIPLMIGIIVLVAMIIPFPSFNLLKLRIIDVVTGGVLGLLGSLLIFPVRADVEFRREAVPLLNAVSDYLSAIIYYLYDHSLEKELTNKKINLEEAWENFPDWVYETGFTSVLQQGHRHFLVRIEEIRQILFTLNHLARYEYDQELLKKFRGSMQSYEAQMKKVIQHIITVLRSGKPTETVEDLSDTFEKIEKKFRTLMPYSLEILEINPDYVYLANFIFELKQLGEMIMILTGTLR
jgi:hypothetical protein